MVMTSTRDFTYDDIKTILSSYSSEYPKYPELDLQNVYFCSFNSDESLCFVFVSVGENPFARNVLDEHIQRANRQVCLSESDTDLEVVLLSETLSKKKFEFLINKEVEHSVDGVNIFEILPEETVETELESFDGL
jgi:hypothetical protein